MNLYGKEGSIYRRNFGKLLLTFSIPAPLAALERLADSKVDDGLLQAAGNVTNALTNAYEVVPSDLLVPYAQGYATRLLALRHGFMLPSQRTQLTRLTARSLLYLGWTRGHTGARKKADRSLDLARSLAFQAEDYTTVAAALATCSQARLRYASNPYASLSVLRRACLLLPDDAPASERCWIQARAASAYAAVGDASSSAELMYWATHELMRSGYDDAEMVESEASFWGRHGSCQFLLNKLDQAESSIRRGLAACSRLRSRARMTATLGAVYARKSEPEGSCAQLMDSLINAKLAGFRTGFGDVAKVRAGFPADWADRSEVCELDEQLRALTT